MRFIAFMFVAMANCYLATAQEKGDSSNSFAPIMSGIDLTGKQPLYFVTERATTKEISIKEFEKIDSRRVFSIYVLKDQNAVDRYGERARYGAIILTMKGKSFSETYPGEK